MSWTSLTSFFFLFFLRTTARVAVKLHCGKCSRVFWHESGMCRIRKMISRGVQKLNQWIMLMWRPCPQNSFTDLNIFFPLSFIFAIHIQTELQNTCGTTGACSSRFKSTEKALCFSSYKAVSFTPFILFGDLAVVRWPAASHQPAATSGRYRRGLRSVGFVSFAWGRREGRRGDRRPPGALWDQGSVAAN